MLHDYDDVPRDDFDKRLILAAKFFDLAYMKEMIAKGANVNAVMNTADIFGLAFKQEGNFSSLMVALRGVFELPPHKDCKLKPIVDMLLLNGAAVNHTTELGNTPLMEATYLQLIDHGDRPTFNQILQSGADVNAVNNNGFTPLGLALLRNDLYKAFQLAEAGAKFTSGVIAKYEECLRNTKDVPCSLEVYTKAVKMEAAVEIKKARKGKVVPFLQVVGKRLR